ncbi:MAG: hypothetical protein NTW32_10240 [Chloroflexi bacterium]|nr:hypothetical protein [Chloroflexota bacterium]
MFSNISDRGKTVLQLVIVLGLLAGVTAIVAYLLATKPVITSSNVYFYVEASGGYSIITLQAGNEKISKPTTVTTPWRRTVRVPSGSQVYLTASNPTQTGSLTCSISFDKLAGQHEKTDAPKDGVACAGIAP